ncbi:aminoacyl-tRNA hydrolase [Candidatus Saccharibacteria bacterium]|nr:aminoacyl-tRNA hydrolase [Candidatus Saccharibacteria bacterium]
MTKLIVGLGNVGKRYANTRHNIGFMVIDELAEQLRTSIAAAEAYSNQGLKISKWTSDDKSKAEIIKAELAEVELILAKPQTMMNLSGDAVQRLMQKYRVKLDDVWVIYDDVDVDFGKLRIRHGATSGQQGIRSITAAIGNQFVHVRMGISLNDRAVEPSEVYVLKPFSTDEQAALPTVIRRAADVLVAKLREIELIEDTTLLL